MGFALLTSRANMDWFIGKHGKLKLGKNSPNNLERGMTKPMMPLIKSNLLTDKSMKGRLKLQ
jgi:hypothetical protein